MDYTIQLNYCKVKGQHFINQNILKSLKKYSCNSQNNQCLKVEMRSDPCFIQTSLLHMDQHFCCTKHFCYPYSDPYLTLLVSSKSYEMA